MPGQRRRRGANARRRSLEMAASRRGAEVTRCKSRLAIIAAATARVRGALLMISAFDFDHSARLIERLHYATKIHHSPLGRDVINRIARHHLRYRRHHER